MMDVARWLDRFYDVNERLVKILETEGGHYSDEKLASVEATLEIRQEMLDEMANHDVSENDRLVYEGVRDRLQVLEAQVEQRISTMMGEIQAKQTSLQKQKKELGTHKRANLSYFGGATSSEGYFIDKRK